MVVLDKTSSGDTTSVRRYDKQLEPHWVRVRALSSCGPSQMERDGSELTFLCLITGSLLPATQRNAENKRNRVVRHLRPRLTDVVWRSRPGRGASCMITPGLLRV